MPTLEDLIVNFANKYGGGKSGTIYWQLETLFQGDPVLAQQYNNDIAAGYIKSFSLDTVPGTGGSYDPDPKLYSMNLPVTGTGTSAFIPHVFGDSSAISQGDLAWVLGHEQSHSVWDNAGQTTSTGGLWTQTQTVSGQQLQIVYGSQANEDLAFRTGIATHVSNNNSDYNALVNADQHFYAENEAAADIAGFNAYISYRQTNNLPIDLASLYAGSTNAQLYIVKTDSGYHLADGLSFDPGSTSHISTTQGNIDTVAALFYKGSSYTSGVFQNENYANGNALYELGLIAQRFGDFNYSGTVNLNLTADGLDPNLIGEGFAGYSLGKSLTIVDTPTSDPSTWVTYRYTPDASGVTKLTASALGTTYSTTYFVGVDQGSAFPSSVTVADTGATVNVAPAFSAKIVGGLNTVNLLNGASAANTGVDANTYTNTVGGTTSTLLISGDSPDAVVTVTPYSGGQSGLIASGSSFSGILTSGYLELSQSGDRVSMAAGTAIQVDAGDTATVTCGGVTEIAKGGQNYDATFVCNADGSLTQTIIGGTVTASGSGTIVSNQSSGQVFVDSGIQIIVNGSNNSVTVAQNGSLTLAGGGNNVNASGNGSTILDTSGGNTVNVGGIGVNVYTAQDDVHVADGASATVTGASNGITAGTGSFLTVTNNGNLITAGEGAHIFLGTGTANNTIDFGGKTYDLTGADSADVTNGTLNIRYGDVVQSTSPDGTTNVTLSVAPDGTTTQTTNTQTPDGTKTTTKQVTLPNDIYTAAADAFGTSLGNILGGSNPLAQVAVGSVLGPAFAGVEQFIESAFAQGSEFDLAQSFNLVLKEFPTSVEMAGAGALGALAFAQVVNAVGITGPAAGILNAEGGYAVSTIATNLLTPGANPITGSIAQDGTHIGDLSSFTGWEGAGATFVGSEIAQAIYQPNTPEGQEGAAVASAVGNSAYLYWAASTGNPYIIAAAAVVAIVDYILGGVIGDLFGQAHTSHIAGASFVVGSTGVTTTNYNYQDGPTDDATAVGELITGVLNNLIKAVGGTLSNASQLTQFGVGFNTDASPQTDVNGYYDSDGGVCYYYDADGVRKQYWAVNTTMYQVTDYAILREASEMQFTGGDPYMERAIDAALRSAVNPTATTLAGDILIAQRYEYYEANKSVINALVASGHDLDWVGLLALAGSMGMGTSVQGSSGNDKLSIVNTVDDAGHPLTDRILIGGGGTDTYVYNGGDGDVTILNGVSTYNYAKGTLAFGANIGFMTGSSTNVTSVALKGADLVLTLTGANAGTVTLKGWLADSFAQLTQATFGSTIVANSMLAVFAGAPGATFINGQAQYPTSGIGVAGSNAYASNGNTIAGGRGGDVLVGGNVANTFILGGGHDIAYGGGAGDIFDFDAAGQLTIYNNENGAGQIVAGSIASGTLNLNAGVSFDQLAFAQGGDGNDLVISIGGTKEITVANWFGNNDAAQLSTITADGGNTTITYVDGNNYLFGHSAENTLGISSNEDYFLSGGMTFQVSYHDANGNLWEHDVDYSDGHRVTTVSDDSVTNLRGADTIVASGKHDTLVGQAGGVSTLVGNIGGELLKAGTGGGVGIAEYTDNNISVTLGSAGAGSATEIYSGLTLSDQLSGITAAKAGGANDTLTANAGGMTLIGDGQSGVLNGYNSTDVAAYQANHAVVDLGAGTATVSGAHDVLNTIQQAAAYGNNDTLIGGSSLWTYLSAFGAHDVLIGGSGGVTQLRGHGTGSTLVAGTGSVQALYQDDGAVVDLAAGTALEGGSDTLIGISTVTITGDNSKVFGGSSSANLLAKGSKDVLEAGAGGGTLTAFGTDDRYQYGINDGTVLIQNADSATTPANELDIDITFDQLSFAKSYDGQDLVVNVGDPANYAMVVGWFTGDSAELTAIKTSDGTTITYTDGNNYLHGVTATNVYGVSSVENYFLSGATAFVVNYYNYTGAQWEHDVVASNGNSTTTVMLDGVHNIRDAGTLIATGANDTLNAGASTTTMTAQGSNDYYQYGVGDGTVLITNQPSGTAPANELDLGVAFGRVSFQKSYDGQNLVVNIGNPAHSATIVGWFTSDAAQVASIKTNDGTTITYADGNNYLHGTSAENIYGIYSNENYYLSGSTSSLVNYFEAVGDQYNAANFEWEHDIGRSDGTSSDTILASHVHNIRDATTLVASGTSDTLTTTMATLMIANGAGDTLIAGSATMATQSNDAGNTLVGGYGTEVVEYNLSNLVGSLATGKVTGANGTDTLIGISALQLFGTATGDTLIGGSTGGTLIANGSGNTLIGGTGGVTTLVSSGAGNTLIGGSGLEMAYYNANNLTIDLGAGTAGSDTLINVAAATGAGTHDILIGASAAGAKTIVAAGGSDTLIGGSAGSTYMYSDGNGETLVAGAGAEVADYAADNMLVNLNTGIAKTIGGTVTDTLIGMAQAAGYGTNDRLVGSDTVGTNLYAFGTADILTGGNGTVTTNLRGHANGSTLIAGTGNSVAYYSDDGATVNLYWGTANEAGTGHASDTLTGIKIGTITGDSSTLSGGNGVNTLTAAGSDDVLIDDNWAGALIANGYYDTAFGGIGADTLIANGSDDTLVGGTGAGTLIANGNGDVLIGNGASTLVAASAAEILTAGAGATTLIVSSTNDMLYGGSGASVLISTASGGDNTLVAGGATNTLTTSGTDDVLIGGPAGVVMRSTGTGDENTLIATTGADTLMTAGLYDTLVAGTSASTLIATGSQDTLFGFYGSTVYQGVAGNTTAYWAANGVNVNLGGANITGITIATVSGTNAKLQSGGVAATLTGAGTTDTLIGGTSGSTLTATGSGDTLVASGTGNKLVGVSGDTSAYFTGASLTVNLAAATIRGITIVTVTGTHDVVTGAVASDVVTAAGASDTLLGGTNAGYTSIVAAGGSDTLVGGSAGTTYMYSDGNNETLLSGAGAIPIAIYTGDTMTVNLGTGTAKVNGASVSDTLIGIGQAEVWGNHDTAIAGSGTAVFYADGTNDTLIGGSGSTQMRGHANGSTLIAGTGLSYVYYFDNGTTINLAAGTAIDTAAGAVADKLIGINIATLYGVNGTIVGNTGADTLTANGNSNTLIAGAGANKLIANGSNDVLIGSSVTTTLYGQGGNDTLIGGSGGVTTLVGDGGGETLVAGTGTKAVVYSADNLVLNMTTGVAKVNGSSTSDTLVGGFLTANLYGAHDTLIGCASGTSALSVFGASDTLIGGTGGLSVLRGHETGSTLVAGTGAAEAVYVDDNMVVSLATNRASLTGSTSDTLVGITFAAVNGDGSTLIAGTGADTLNTNGTGDTLIAASGASTLTATGSGDSLVAGGGASTLVGSGTGDFYDVASTNGSTTIFNGSGGTTASNELDFGSGLTDEKLWLVQSGNDLKIDLLGTTKAVTVKGWFSGTGSQLSAITAGGLTLDAKVSQLVQAMATYQAAHTAFDPTTATVMPTDTTLQNAIAASWHT